QTSSRWVAKRRCSSGLGSDTITSSPATPLMTSKTKRLSPMQSNGASTIPNGPSPYKHINS
ncbi:MAG: hypothetical protein IKH52_00650, partial [Bacteroidaceae bacterium]|nr:hypothetical protein [Bacteroidaceae bacterium]